MQPTDYPIQYERLQTVWEQYILNGGFDADEHQQIDPGVLASWRRCKPRFDATSMPRPRRLSGDSLTSLLRAQADLISVAIPFLEDMHQFMEGSGAAILLLDGATCALAVEGDASARDFVDTYGFGVGTYWSESYLGTNGFSVALTTTMPAQVVGAEHYFRSLHHLTTTAAPIHNVRGRIIGLIGVICAAEKSTSQSLSLVMAVARAISNQLQANLYMEEVNRKLTEVKAILETIEEGVLAWKAGGSVHHVNKQAAELLQLNPSAILGKPIADALTFPPGLQQAIGQNQELFNAETTFSVNGADVEAFVSLRILTELGQPVGYIVSVRPIEQVRRIVHQQVGSQATLTLDDVFTRSQTMRPLLRQARVAARGMAPVLLRGEGGVGKNHLARAIHNAGERADKPFLAINCRAIPRELLISEFLGYEESSERDGRPSKFELAEGGTLLLDRIESLSLEMQAALLQVIETKYVMRLGGTRPLPVNVRIIAATSADLEKAVAEGNFLSHLYYRFGVFNLQLPPLRERLEDIPSLAEHFLTRLSQQRGDTYELADDTLAVLQRYPWPGNVRELEMVLERALHQCQNGRIHVVDLSETVRTGRVMTGKHPNAQPVLSAEEAEREAIMRAGHACQGRVTEMAARLGISRTTLWRKMKRYQIKASYFRQ